MGYEINPKYFEFLKRERHLYDSYLARGRNLSGYLFFSVG